ncbi:MAG TPA: amidohydrolase family protein [Dongiaceae bacterium]|nr:amidohydrolase family protein [Dongiaceae bacterium]
MKLADAHMHLFPQGYRRTGHRSLFGAHELEAYDALRASHGIERALAIGYETDGLDPDNNSYLRRLAGEHDWLCSLAYVEAGSDPEPETIERLLHDGHCGLAIYAPGAAQAQVVRRWPRPIWDLLGVRGALVSFNARPEAIQLLLGLVREAPDVAFLFSHLGLPGQISADMTVSALRARLAPLLSLAGCSNVFVKVSGLYATSEPSHAYPHRGGEAALRMLLDAFGPRQCLWASDFAPALDFVSFPQTIDIAALDALAPADRALVFRDNLVRLLDAFD